MATLIRIDNHLINLDDVTTIFYISEGKNDFGDQAELTFRFSKDNSKTFIGDTATNIWQGLCRMAVLSNV